MSNVAVTRKVAAKGLVASTAASTRKKDGALLVAGDIVNVVFVPAGAATYLWGSVESVA